MSHAKRRMALIIRSIEQTFFSKVWEDSKWLVRSKLRSETVGATPCRCWASPGCLWRWPVRHPRRPADLRRTWRRKRLHWVTRFFSVRKKSPTSACRPSMSSTRKMPLHLSPAKKWPGEAAAAAGVAAEVAGVAGEAARVVEAAAAAVSLGDVAASARRVTSLTDAGRYGRAPIDPAGHLLFAAVPVRTRGSGQRMAAESGPIASTKAGA